MRKRASKKSTDFQSKVDTFVQAVTAKPLSPGETDILTKALDEVIDDKTNAEALDRADHDPETKREMAQLQQNAAMNKNLADEVLAMMFNDELGHIWGTDGQSRYVDLELEPVFNYDSLRRAGKTEAPLLIKNHRRLQLMNFAKSVSSKYTETETGFTLVYDDDNYQPSKEEKKVLDEWTSRLVKMLFFPPYNRQPDMSNFLKVCYEDFFDLDDISMETRRTMDGTPLGLHLLDPKYIKPMIPQYSNLPRYDRDQYQAYVDDPTTSIDNLQAQAVDYEYIFQKKQKNYAKYTSDFMYKAHFFQSSDFRLAKRGYGIVQQGVKILTYIVNALVLNSSNFTVNRRPDGVFLLTGGGVNIVQLEKMRKIFNAYGTGAMNRNRFPIMGTPAGGDGKWVAFRQSSKEMEYHLWFTLLMSILCQLSGTNPEEISLASNKQAMQTGGLSKPNEERIYNESKDTGLKMFLIHIENMLNRVDSTGKTIWTQILESNGVSLPYPLKCKFAGTELKNEKLAADLDTKKLATDTSVNDLLEAQDKERQEFEFAGQNLFDIRGISNPQIFTALNGQQQQMNQEKQAKQQAEMQGQQQKEGELSPRDADLVNKYGSPDEGKEEGKPNEEEENSQLENIQ